jgi:hypothetical protein
MDWASRLGQGPKTKPMFRKEITKIKRVFSVLKNTKNTT